MTKYFEVVRRDGPARMGKLLTDPQISTPALITKDDYVSAGSVYSYASLQDAIKAAQALQGQKKLAILPYVPAALRSEPALELPPQELAGPKGVMVHPFSATEPEKADVYVLGSSGALKNPRDLVAAIVSVREKIAPDTALYAPALATPANLALLVYLGIDLLDGTRVVADGLLGRYHTSDGVWKASELVELPCRCENCREMVTKGRKAELLIAHNLHKLEEELLAVREVRQRLDAPDVVAVVRAEVRDALADEAADALLQLGRRRLADGEPREGER